jgi:hypothetical protein
VQSPCNSLIEDYTETFYTIDEGDMPTLQYNMSLKGPKSMRKVDCLSPKLIDFYVPAHTPCLNSTETSLKLSENITLFAVCRIYTGVPSAKRLIDTRCLARIVYKGIYTVQRRAQYATMWHPCLYIAWRRHVTFGRDSEFSLRKKRAIKLA